MTSSEDVVVLRKDETTEVSIKLHGATIISWKDAGNEVLFLSKQAVFDNKKAIRGGIPLVFPCFGPWKYGPQHGFARIKRWNIESEPCQESGKAVVSLSLEDDEETRKAWNYRFKLVYTVELGHSCLKLSLNVLNRDTMPFEFTTLMHTYFRCQDISNVKVKGLAGLQYVDKVREGKQFHESRQEVVIDENYDRVYQNCDPNSVTVESIASGNRSVKLALSNLPDIVVWNPWEEKAKAMSDFGDDEYRNMVCVEAGSVSQQVTIQANENLIFSQTLNLI